MKTKYDWFDLDNENDVFLLLKSFNELINIHANIDEYIKHRLFFLSIREYESQTITTKMALNSICG